MPNPIAPPSSDQPMPTSKPIPLAVDKRSNDQSQNRARQAGRMQDQAMLKINNGNDPEIDQHDHAEGKPKRL